MRIPEIVYLAKSNAGDLDLIDDIRAKIDAYKVEIKEFTGGTYTTDKLVTCHALIVVPCIAIPAYATKFNIGRGVYSEILTAQKKNIPVYIAAINGNDDVHLALISDIEMLEADWGINWARVKFDSIRPMAKLFESKPKLSATQQLFENMELEGKSSDAIEKGRVKPYLALYKRSTV